MKRYFLFAVLLGAVTAAWGLGRAGLEAFEVRALVGRLGEVRDAWWAVPLFFASFGATSALVPAFAFFVSAGAVWGAGPGFVAGWLAANAWSHLHFIVGRRLGRGRVEAWLARPRLRRAGRAIEGGGALSILILRQLPLPFVGVNLAAGASPIRWSRWTMGNAAGLVPASLIYSWSAASILAGVEGAREDAAWRVAAAAGALILFGLVTRLVSARARGGTT